MSIQNFHQENWIILLSNEKNINNDKHMHTQVWTNWLKLFTKQLYEVWHEAEDSSMMNGVEKSTVGGQLLLIGPPSRRWRADVNLQQWADGEPKAACRLNSTLRWWRADGGLTLRFCNLNKEMQMICTGVYSHFASRKLKSIVNLWEKQKWMINMCIKKDEGTEWNF